mgnify:FL=1
MNWKPAVAHAAIALSFGALAVATKQYAMMDELCNLSVPYLCTLFGIALLLVGAHCALFGCSVRALPFRPNMVLFVLVALALNCTVVWDGAFRERTWADILFNMANTSELTLFYAAFLFVPRFGALPAASEPGAS